MSNDAFLVRGILNQAVQDRHNALVSISARPTIIPVNLASIRLALGEAGDIITCDPRVFTSELAAELKSKYSKKIYIMGEGFQFNGMSLEDPEVLAAASPGLIMQGDNPLGVLYSSAKDNFNASKALFTDTLNKLFIKYLVDKRTNFHRGHLNLELKGQSLADTPVSSNISLVKEYANSVKQGLDIDLSIKQKRVLDKVYSSMSELNTQLLSLQSKYSVYKTGIKAKLSKEFTDAALRINANIIIIQHSKENLSWSSVEKSIQQKMRDIIADIHFSRNIKEEVGHRLVESIKGSKVKSTSALLNIEELISTKRPKGTQVLAKLNPPKLRNVQTGRFTSIANLQSLLNQALVSQVKRNMGKGNRKDILNLRSGRFAESVKVERMSQSREGMITAFYSYMKYPYQTFEPGFRQGRPQTRDPKLLISKSIREIAATMVGNKLRAVRL